MKAYRETVQKLFGKLAGLSHSTSSGLWVVKKKVFIGNRMLPEVLGVGKTPQEAIDNARKDGEK